MGKNVICIMADLICTICKTQSHFGNGFI